MKKIKLVFRENKHHFSLKDSGKNLIRCYRCFRCKDQMSNFISPAVSFVIHYIHIHMDRTPPHARVPVTITVTVPVGWTWDSTNGHDMAPPHTSGAYNIKGYLTSWMDMRQYIWT
ncbi:hypothetical protein AVEN_196359-1 [Araneus ventricosus]|uniref:Uncharacterized protein n=1 Tax=Araneus ventricosus TaxID=182803 RepID=A0A4Y2ATZ6_ARAVE|nr:hypothetical protein AVEN_196359-1 [Araneus ventricosus]